MVKQVWTKEKDHGLYTYKYCGKRDIFKFKIRHQHILTMNAVMVLKLRTRYR